MNQKAVPTPSKPEETAPNADTLDSRRFVDLLQGPLDTRSLPLTILLVLACLYTVYFAKPFLLPIVLAILLTFLFRPIVATMARARVPEPVGAAVVVLGLVGVTAAAIYGLSGPASAWVRDAPEMMSRVEDRIRPILRPMKQVNDATAQVEAKLHAEDPAAPEAVEIKQPGFGSTLLTRAGAFLTMLTVVVILLYFLLASGDLFLRKLVKVLPNFQEKKQAVEIAQEIRQGVSTYLLTVSMIYLSLGVVVAVAMWLLGMPNPILWGVTAGLLNFIPYLGAMVTGIILTAVAILTFDNLGHAALVPIVFIIITTIEGYFVTPLVLGHRLTLNPVVIFLGMTFWWWLWGIPGALLAVPMLATLKIICDRIEPLSPVGEFLGQ